MHHHDLEVFKQHYQVMALIDNDPKSNKCRKAFLAKCSELKIPAVRLKGYSIENYFSPNALMQVFGNQITPNLAIKRDIKLESQIGFSVKHNNRKIARAMSLQDLSGTDLDAFLDQAAEACKALYGEKDAVSTEHINNIK